jgi:DNA-binding MarR family transcriptional regulator
VELLKIETSQTDGNDSISRQVEVLRERLGSAMRLADQLVGSPETPAFTHAVTECYIRNMIKLRRHRDRFFASELFADPAWDMLLELYAAALGQFRVSISNLCVAAAVPPTTALRWIKQLEEAGLVDRRPDRTDGRRMFIMLSDEALSSMNAYFRTVPVGASLI